jgi:hypothetical protein
MNFKTVYTKPRPRYVPLKDPSLEKEFGDPNREGGGVYRVGVVGRTDTHLQVVALGFLPKARPVRGTVPIGWLEEKGFKEEI